MKKYKTTEELNKMAKQNINQPKDRIDLGSISLVQWENMKNGKAFDSFSINKTVRKIDESDSSRFTGRFLSINGLTKHDLSMIKQAILELEERISGISCLKEGA